MKYLLTGDERARLAPYNPASLPESIYTLCLTGKNERLWMAGWIDNGSRWDTHRTLHAMNIALLDMGHWASDKWLAWDELGPGAAEFPDEPPLIEAQILNSLGNWPLRPEFFWGLKCSDEEAVELVQALVMDGAEVASVVLPTQTWFYAAPTVGRSAVFHKGVTHEAY